MSKPKLRKTQSKEKIIRPITGGHKKDSQSRFKSSGNVQEYRSQYLIRDDPMQKFEADENLEIIPMNIKINSTKVEKFDSEKRNTVNLNNMTKADFLLDEDLNEKLRKLEENLLGGKEKINKQQIKSNDEYQNKVLEYKTKKEENNFPSEKRFNSPLKRDNEIYDSEGDEERELFTNMNNDMIKKFDNLNDLEEGMKKLNQILDFSAKSSMKFKVNHENDFFDKNLETKQNNYNLNTNTYANFIKENNFDNKFEENIYQKNKNIHFDNYVDHDEELNEPIPYKTQKSENFEKPNFNKNYKMDNYSLPIKNSPIINQNSSNANPNNTNTNEFKPSHYVPKTKSIEINKSRKVIDIDKTKYIQAHHINNDIIAREAIVDENGDDLDYLKSLLLKTKSDLENFNKNLEIRENPQPKGNHNHNIKYSQEYDDEIEPREPPKNYQFY